MRAPAAGVTLASLWVLNAAAFRRLSQHQEHPRNAVASRKVVELAKGILMARYEWTGEQASLALLSEAAANGVTVGQLAAAIIAVVDKSR